MAKSKEFFLNVTASRKQESIKITIDAEDEEKIKALRWWKIFRNNRERFTISTYLSGRYVSLQCIILGKKVSVRWINGDRFDYRKENLEPYGPERPIQGSSTESGGTTESGQDAGVIRDDPADWRMTDWSDFRSEKWEYVGKPSTTAPVKQDPQTFVKQDRSIQSPKVCGFSPAIAEILTSPVEVGADSPDAIQEYERDKQKRKFGSAPETDGFVDLSHVVSVLTATTAGAREVVKSDTKDLIKAGLSITQSEDF